MGDGIFAQLYRPDSTPTDVYSITFISSGPELTGLNPVRWALWSEGHYGLAATQMHRIQFGTGVGFLWHHDGPVEGWKLGRPQQHTIPIHMTELWSANPLGLVTIALATPPDKTEEAWPGFNTVIASWGWD